MTATTTVHIAKSYPTGIGHIDARDGMWLVSFYQSRGRVVQRWVTTLQAARFMVRLLASV